jgi:hypothetical protein
MHGPERHDATAEVTALFSTENGESERKLEAHGPEGENP